MDFILYFDLVRMDLRGLNSDVLMKIKEYLICAAPDCDKFIESYDKYEVDTWCLGSFDTEVLGELFFELYMTFKTILRVHGVFNRRGHNPYFLLLGGLVRGCVEFRGITIDIDLYGNGNKGCRECCLNEIELIYEYLQKKCNLFIYERGIEEESDWNESDSEWSEDGEPDSEDSIEMDTD